MTKLDVEVCPVHSTCSDIFNPIGLATFRNIAEAIFIIKIKQRFLCAKWLDGPVVRLIVHLNVIFICIDNP